jgi:tetratricopeptide (TPR) repeat protein
MQSSHRIATLHFGVAIFLFLSLIVLGTSTSTNAQQPASNPSEERDRGIQLYQQGDAMGAIELLRKAVEHHKDDISAWHCLGLSLQQVEKRDDARKAHEKAAKIADALLSSSLDRAINLPKTQLLEAADSAERYLALSVHPSKKKTEEWRDRADFLRVFAPSNDLGVKAYSGKDVTTKPRVLSKPEPTYTEDARKHQITGTVILRCIFAADGRVINIVPIRGLRYGLTRKAITVAYAIKFIPATKDGHPVSM